MHQAKHWKTKVCSRARFYSRGNQRRRQRMHLKSTSPNTRVLGYLWDKAEVCGRGERWLELRRDRAYHHSAQAQLRHLLPQGLHVWKMAALARSEGGVLDPLMSKCHRADTHACPVGGSWAVSTSLGACTGHSWLQVSEKNNLGNHLIV